MPRLIARQGDVAILLHESRDLTGFRKLENVRSHVVAWGEATGHAHVLTDLERAEVYVNDDGAVVVIPHDTIHLRHGVLVGDEVTRAPDTHSPIALNVPVLTDLEHADVYVNDEGAVVVVPHETTDVPRGVRVGDNLIAAKVSGKPGVYELRRMQEWAEGWHYVQD